jgi:hypothetical protein
VAIDGRANQISSTYSASRSGSILSSCSTLRNFPVNNRDLSVALSGARSRPPGWLSQHPLWGLGASRHPGGLVVSRQLSGALSGSSRRSRQTRLSFVDDNSSIVATRTPLTSVHLLEPFVRNADAQVVRSAFFPVFLSATGAGGLCQRRSPTASTSSGASQGSDCFSTRRSHPSSRAPRSPSRTARSRTSPNWRGSVFPARWTTRSSGKASVFSSQKGLQRFAQQVRRDQRSLTPSGDPATRRSPRAGAQARQPSPARRLVRLRRGRVDPRISG